MKQIAVIIFGLLIFSLACKKAKGPSLPRETQTGANTIGFKLNGKVYSTMGKLGNSLFMRSGVRFNGPNIRAVSFGEEKFRSMIAIMHNFSYIDNDALNDGRLIIEDNQFVDVGLKESHKVLLPAFRDTPHNATIAPDLEVKKDTWV